MEKTAKNIFQVLLIIMISSSLLIISKPISNAASAAISCSSSIEVNKTVTISVTGSAVQWNLTLAVNGEKIANSSELENYQANKSINFSGSYTPTSTGTLNVTLSGSITEANDGSTIKSFTSKNITVKEATPTPTTNNTTNNSSETDAKVVTPTETKTTTTKTSDKTTKSSNNSLKSLTVSKGNLDPEFNRSTKEYTVDLSNEENATSINSITIGAKAENSKATVNGTGDKDLSDGENNFDINVTAEDGTETTYKVKVIKPKKLTQSDLRLKALEVNKINTVGQIAKVELNKAFDAETFDYTCNLEKDIDKLDITANVDNDNILVEISGTKNLTSGVNKATITLTAKDDSTVKSVYTITANKEKDVVQVSTEPETENGFKFDYKIAIYVGAGVIGLLILILIILLIVNKKQKKAKETSDEENNYKNKEFANNDSNNEEDDEYKSKLDFANGEPTYKVDTENSADNNSDTDKEESENIEEDKSKIDEGIKKVKDLEKNEDFDEPENLKENQDTKENKKNISLKNENDENNCNTENEKYSDNYYIDDNNKDKKHSKSNKGKRFI